LHSWRGEEEEDKERREEPRQPVLGWKSMNTSRALHRDDMYIKDERQDNLAR
jgi:hypothetical protein